jgi:hypothetical protein
VTRRITEHDSCSLTRQQAKGLCGVPTLVARLDMCVTHQADIVSARQPLPPVALPASCPKCDDRSIVNLSSVAELHQCVPSALPEQISAFSVGIAVPEAPVSPPLALQVLTSERSCSILSTHQQSIRSNDESRPPTPVVVGKAGQRALSFVRVPPVDCNRDRPSPTAAPPRWRRWWRGFIVQ